MVSIGFTSRIIKSEAIRGPERDTPERRLGLELHGDR